MKLLFPNLFIFALTLFTSCNQGEQKENSDPAEHSDHYFNIEFGVEEGDKDSCALVFTFELNHGNYFVSPYSEGHHQRLIFSIQTTDSLRLIGELIEHPRTMEEFDEQSDKGGNFVREKTKYIQNLSVQNEDDFEVQGLIWFQILPIRQPYEIAFVISQKNGIIEANQKSITTSTYPTFWDKKRVDNPEEDFGTIY